MFKLGAHAFGTTAQLTAGCASQTAVVTCCSKRKCWHASMQHRNAKVRAASCRPPLSGAGPSWRPPYPRCSAACTPSAAAPPGCQSSTTTRPALCASVPATRTHMLRCAVESLWSSWAKRRLSATLLLVSHHTSIGDAEHIHRRVCM